MTIDPSWLPLVLGGGGLGALLMTLLAWKREPREARTAELTDTSTVVVMYKHLAESHARQIEQLEHRNQVLAERVQAHEARIETLEGRLRSAEADRASDARRWEAERASLLETLERLKAEKTVVENELVALKERTADG